MVGATGRWFSTGTPVFSTNKVDRHDTAEILLKEAITIISCHIRVLRKIHQIKKNTIICLFCIIYFYSVWSQTFSYF